MPDPILWLLLSLGTGAAYALLGNGIVAIYKGSGVLNFAQGAVAMFATYCYLHLVLSGMSKYLAIAIVVPGAAVAGAAVAVVIFRPLRAAPALAKVVATLGLLVALQGMAQVIWGNQATLTPSLFPINGVSVGGTYIGVNRFYMAATAIGIAVLLWALYRFTRSGLATQATSQNEKGAALLGYSPTVISAANWGLGCALAALAGALIAPLTGLDTAGMTLLVLPALVAALVGRFSSFGITTVAAFGIAWAQIWLFNVWTLPGVQNAAPFALVILVMVVAGRALPGRGAVSEGRPPFAPVGATRWLPIAICAAVALVMLLTFNLSWLLALTTTFTTAIVALSLVVLTGYVGQISLMQMTFAGLGGFITAKLASDYHVPFPLSIIAAAADRRADRRRSRTAGAAGARAEPRRRDARSGDSGRRRVLPEHGLDERRQRHARSRAEAVRAVARSLCAPGPVPGVRPDRAHPRCPDGRKPAAERGRAADACRSRQRARGRGRGRERGSREASGLRTFGLDRRARRRTRGVLESVLRVRAIRGTPSCRRSRC